MLKKRFFKAIEIDPEFINSISNLGLLYLQGFNDPSRAKPYFDKSLEIDPNSSAAYNGLAGYYKKQKDYKTAEALYKKAIEIDGRAKHYHNLGNLYQFSTKDYDSAKVTYEKALEIEPSLYKTWVAYGNLLHYRLSDENGAEQAFKKAIELNGGYSLALNGLAEVLMSRGDFLQAIEFLKEAIEVDSELYFAHVNLAEMLEITHQCVEAREILERAIKLENRLEDKLSLVILVRDRMGDVDSAKAIFEEIPIAELSSELYHLHRSTFGYYARNFGIAEADLAVALREIKEAKLSNTLDDWYMNLAAILKMGEISSVIDVFRKTGYDKVLRPFFVALRSFEENNELFLNSVALEVREPAEEIIQILEDIVNR